MIMIPKEQTPDEQILTDTFRLRRCLLMTLYRFFMAHPYAAMEFTALSETCEATARDLNWNMVYLEKSGYVELTRSGDCLPYVACAAAISAPGIDLVEKGRDFDERFPVSP